MAGVVSLATLLLVATCIGFSKQEDIPRVESNVGTILGSHRTSETGKDIFSFSGIPYIEPPLEGLRFKPPVPAKPFTGDFNATRDDYLCPQNLFGNVMGDEDCVILNVHTPWDPSSSAPATLLPVMVFIHGGGFVLGSSITSVSGMPDYLLEHDVVLVTINYRIGVFGFLSTGDGAAPGNYGLLDQVEALRWVKNNIAAFGGNPDQVTIFGESAGSASVHYLMLTPLAKGLFHRAIAQSGTSLCPWARTAISDQNTNILAGKLNCSVSSSSDMLDCLRKQNAIDLVKTDVVEEAKRASEMEPFVWVPKIDHEADSPFLPRHPIDIMKSGKYNKVPLLIGHTKDEGGSFLGLAKEPYQKEVEKFTKGWDNLCKVSTGSRENMIPEEQGTEMCKQIKEHYIDPDKSFEQSKLRYANMTGDIFIVTGVYKTIELMSDEIPTYGYSFNYDNGRVTLMGLLFGTGFNHVKGIVPHADDLLYIFKYPKTNWTVQSPAYEMVQMMTKIWTDFAKTGKPSLPNQEAWPQATSMNPKYVVIDSVPRVDEDYRPEDMEFMKDIFSQSLFNTSIGSDASTSFSIHQFLLLPICLIVLTIVYFV